MWGVRVGLVTLGHDRATEFLHVSFGLLFEKGLCIRLEVKNLPVFPGAVHTILLPPGVVGLWVAFDIEERLGCHGHEHCVSDALLGLFGLFLYKLHCLNVLRNSVVCVVVLAHVILESQDLNLVVARCILLEVEEDCHCRDIVHINWRALAEG